MSDTPTTPAAPVLSEADARLLEITEEDREEYKDEVRWIDGIVCDYPHGEPYVTVDYLGSSVSAGVGNSEPIILPLLGLAAVVYWACWRCDDREIVDGTRRGLVAAEARLRTMPCHCGGAEHPTDTDAEDLTIIMGCLVDPQEAEDYYAEEWEPRRRGWTCPQHLAGLAASRLADMDEMLAEGGPVAQARMGIYAETAVKG
ncbi:hypothetical protein ACIBFB_06940 [Nocardiopsis sp. NPDC050513]|uniref:hypothetical protein n=1 Tax=Nocardiopsis sp. NPDC050513 TaxID=3364338 RepID=UPI0037BCD4EC